MNTFLMFLKVFIFGGALSALGQILIDRTKLTPAKILTAYVVAGVILTAVGLYKPLVDIFEAGATVPLTGFGYALAVGVRESVAERGAIGILTGGLSACAAGVAAAIAFGFAFALVSRSTDK